MDNKKLTDIDRQIVNAHTYRIRGPSIPLIVNCNRADFQVATGILLREANEIFVLTCKHCTNLAQSGGILFVPSRGRVLSGNDNDLVREFLADNAQWPDVAVIRTYRDKMAKILGDDATPLDMNDICFEINFKSCVLVGGFMADLIEHTTIGPHAKRQEHLFHGYTEHPIPYENWPTVDNPDPSTDKTVDIFVPYEINAQTTVLDSEDEQEHPFESRDPAGLSGGGMWQPQPTSSQIVHPNLKLVGIQCRANKKRYLRGCKIQHAVNLINRRS